MNPVIWKLSMGPGALYGEFKNLLLVLDWLRQGLVLVHKNTGPIGSALETQGEKFVRGNREGDYFYLCHGNQTPSILLLGKFIGPAIDIPKQKGWKRTGWAGRKFEWIATSLSPRRLPGKSRGWTPKHRSTFCEIPAKDTAEFQSRILLPYFKLKVTQLA